MARAPSPSTDGWTDDDRRAALRSPTMERAKIVASERAGEIDCIIRNISVSGALLVLEDTADVPETFDLVSSDHPPLHYRVAWRTDHRVGVQFDDAPTLPVGG